MNKIIVNYIRIVDFSKEKSCIIKFKDGVNVVTSKNTSRGKSSILRAIYHAIGANSGYDKSFNAQNKIFDIGFNYSNKSYRIIRNKNKYYCYVNSKLKIVSINYKQLSHFFEEEFGISVYLTDKKGIFDIAPTTYLFIPYFADQDMTWKELKRIPFANNQQFSDNSLIDLYYYHIGILNKAYYSCNNKRINYQTELDAINNTNNELREQIFSIKKYFDDCQISIDENSAKANIDFIKNEIDKYLITENEIKTSLFMHENNIVKLKIQIEKINEILKDFKNIKSHIKKCPNCGYEINNEKNCTLYQNELLNKKLELNKYDLDNENKEYEETKKQYLNIVNQIDILTKKYTNENKLFEKYLKTQTSKILLGDLENNYNSNCNRTEELNNNIQEIDDLLKLYKEKKLNANKRFKDLYLKNLNDLGMNMVDRKDLRNFEIYLKSGSQRVRSMLAFFITIIQLKIEYNKEACIFPFVIDSPLEGEQDDIDKDEIINKIFEVYNKNQMGNQFIVAALNAQDIFSSNDTINYIKLDTEKEHLLTNENYLNDNEIEVIKELITQYEY